MARRFHFISIIIPTRGRPQKLRDCLRAIACLDYPRDCFEVIVVDDGGPEPLAEIVSGWARQINVALVVQEHAGPAAARNCGARRARGDLFAFTDDDCAPDPAWLRALDRVLNARPDALVGGRTDNRLTGNVYAAASQLLIDYLYDYYNTGPTGAQFFTANNMALAAAAFWAVGGFDRSFPLAAAEDREFCRRWREQGKPLVYEPAALIHHAHALSLASFCRQHFNYGRGAYHFHRMKAADRGSHRLEPGSFYIRMLRYPFGRRRGLAALWTAGLLAAAQVANAAGFGIEAASLSAGTD